MRSIIPYVLALAAGAYERRPTLADIRREPRGARPINRTPRGPYAGTESHPIKDALRMRRKGNAHRKFATGHWQHRVITAVPV